MWALRLHKMQEENYCLLMCFDKASVNFAGSKSNLSSIVTLVHEDTKSCRKYQLESTHGYALHTARSCELLPSTKSTWDAVQGLPVRRLLWKVFPSPTGDQVVFSSSKLMKYALSRVPGWSVNTPTSDWSVYAFRMRSPPTRTTISGVVSNKRWASSQDPIVTLRQFIVNAQFLLFLTTINFMYTQ